MTATATRTRHSVDRWHALCRCDVGEDLFNPADTFNRR